MATGLFKRRSGSELGEQLEKISKAMSRAQTVRQSDVYSGKSLRVSVDGSGVSRVRSRAPRGRGR